MNYDELMSLIEQNPWSDERWVAHYDHANKDQKIYTLKSNLDVRIVLYGTERGFEEEWATQFPDPSACTVDYEIYFRSSLVESFFLVGVDGLRAMLPLPESGQKKTVQRLRYAVARAIDFKGNLDEYMRRAGLTVEPM